jgi:hypothetical protein
LAKKAAGALATAAFLWYDRKRMVEGEIKSR